jgi:hypothetical protein
MEENPVVNGNLALTILGVAVLVWCAGLSAYAVWANESQSKASLDQLTRAFEAHLINSGKEFRKKQQL